MSMRAVTRYVLSVGRASTPLVGGSLGSQFILLAISPLITRLYAPDEFALLNVFTSLIALFAGLSVLRLDVAVFAAEPGRVPSLTVLASVIAAAFSILLGVAFYMFCVFRGVDFAQINLLLLSVLLIIGNFGTALFAMVSSAAVRLGHNNEVGIARLVQSLSGGAVQVIAGLLGAGAVGLLLGQILSQAIGAGGLWRKSVSRTHMRKLIPVISGLFAKYVGTRFRRYALYSAPASVINRFTSTMIIVLFAMIYDLAVVGLLALTFRAANAPMLAVARGVTQVFQKEFARKSAFAPHQIMLIFICILVLLGSVPVLVLVFWGEGLFSLVFGNQWSQAGQFAAIMAPAFLLQFVAYPLTQSMSLSNNNRIQLLWDVTRAVLLLAVFAGLFWFHLPASTGVRILSVYLSLIYAAQILLSFLLVRNPIGVNRPEAAQ